MQNFIDLLHILVIWEYNTIIISFRIEKRWQVRILDHCRSVMFFAASRSHYSTLLLSIEWTSTLSILLHCLGWHVMVCACILGILTRHMYIWREKSDTRYKDRYFICVWFLSIEPKYLRFVVLNIFFQFAAEPKR